MDDSSSKRRTTTLEEEALLHDNTITPKDDRRIRGKLLRESVPHQEHGKWKPAGNRPDPLELLEDSNRGRIQELIPLRYGRMLHSPFTFYRGAAAIMAYDLSSTPTIGVPVQACGDCHLLNFGAYSTPERNIVFDINDFDETLPAPWEWDLKRLAASFVLVARENGLKSKIEEAAGKAVAQSYRNKIIEYSRMNILDIWYAHLDWQSVIEQTSDEQLQKHRKDELKRELKRTIGSHYFPKLTQQFDGRFFIKDSPPTIYHPADSEKEDFRKGVLEALALYRESLQEDRQRLFGRYQLADIAMKVVGIGSVGTTCAVALLLAPGNEPLLLQIKEARASVLETFAGKSTYDNNGRRVVAGQRIAQSASDIFLGWTKFRGKDFYVRQLRDTKVKPEPELWDGPQLLQNAQVMGWVLARAHARSGDAAVMRGYLGSHETFEDAISAFAVAYADQVEEDHAALVSAVHSGKIKATIEQ